MFVDAMLGDTMDLSAEEFGAYHLLLYAIWRSNGRPLPDDDKKLARICRVTVARWKRVLRPALVGYFDQDAIEQGGEWIQKRLKKEWDFVAKRRAKQSEKGTLSAKAKGLKTQETASTAVDMRLQPKPPSGSNRKPTPNPNPNNTPCSPPLPSPPPDGPTPDVMTALGEEVMDLAGVDHTTSTAWHMAGPAVARWTGWGATPDLIRSVVKAKAGQLLDRGGGRARSPSYFDAAIREEVHRAQAESTATTSGDDEEIPPELLIDGEPMSGRCLRVLPGHQSELLQEAQRGGEVAACRLAKRLLTEAGLLSAAQTTPQNPPPHPPDGAQP
jgi:uncharacterized protein YdaU (DUF1376 family)